MVAVMSIATVMSLSLNMSASLVAVPPSQASFDSSRAISSPGEYEYAGILESARSSSRTTRVGLDGDPNSLGKRVVAEFKLSAGEKKMSDAQGLFTDMIGLGLTSELFGDDATIIAAGKPTCNENNMAEVTTLVGGRCTLAGYSNTTEVTH